MAGMIKTEQRNLVKAGVMARMLGVPVAWIKSEARSGKLPHLEAGNVILFNPQVVESLLAERAAQPVESRSQQPAS